MFAWFKELFVLIQMIFGRTEKCDKLEILQMKYFPFKNYSYMMWCGKLVTRKNITIRNIPSHVGNHENGHLIQAKFYKWWIQYYLVYFWEWLKGIPFWPPFNSAYYTIPFEVQAYANQHIPEYDYNREDLKSKYTIKYRKREYKKNKTYWKNYIKYL